MKKIITIFLSLSLITILSGCSLSMSKNSKVQPEIVSDLSESEARVIAESACINERESLGSGYYNENSKTWWFDAVLNLTPSGCNPACVVFTETEMAEINWRCTGLIVPDASIKDALEQLFFEKYPEYSETLSVNINQETDNHVRGQISFEPGAPGGIFLATNISGNWQIVFDGNGSISCDLSEYEFPDEMLQDCVK